jgi:ABC-2 type transport system permease protein
MVARDLRLGRRSPIFIVVVVTPLIITALNKLGPPPDARPQLGVVDQGQSEIASSLCAMNGVRLTLMESEGELREHVMNRGLDAGLVLADGFDARIRAGERPVLDFFVSGESFPSNRVLLAATMIDLVRKVEDRAAPVEVEVERVGEGRMLPARKMHVLFSTAMVLSMGGIFLPALTLVEERERGTLSAVLMTPATISEVLVAKAVLGFLMATATAYLTVVLNSALPHEPSALLLTLAVAAIICVATGLIFGTFANNSQGVFALMESVIILFLGTMLLCMGSNWAQLLAKCIPTYWFILPLYQIAVMGAGFAEVWGNLLVGLGMAAAMVVPIILLGRRMQAKLATT